MAAGPNAAETIDGLKRQLAAALAERDGAQARETALAEVLQAINTSSGEIALVFDMIIGKAMTLCDAAFGALLAYDNDRLTLAASRNAPPALAEYWTKPQFLDPAGGTARVLVSGETSQIADLAQSESYRLRLPMTVASVELGGIRTLIQVPLLGERGPIGLFVLYRQEVRPFSERQIALVEAFAAQAALALENARLFAEQREALEQQTATAEVLRAINASQGDLQPVFDLITDKALAMCNADGADLLAFNDGLATALVLRNPTPAQVDFWKTPFDLRRGAIQLETDPRTRHFADLSETEIYKARLPLPVMAVEGAGMRTLVQVPLTGESGLIGQFALFRRKVRPFSAKQIALVETFAAQAALAIENARLMTEQREALEQQTATAEILRVISQSPTDIAPVMTAVAKAAVRFCGAEDAHVFLRDGDEIVSSAHEGPLSAHPMGHRDPLDIRLSRAQAIIEARVTEIVDTLALDPEQYPATRAYSLQHGFRAQLNAPLLQGDRAIGCICLRRRDPGAFTPRQIELLETFAAQAVIAIENVRLFTELRDSLERLKAAQANLIQSEKMASLGQLTAGIAHEIKNPLNFVNNFAGLSVELLAEIKEVMAPAFSRLDEDKRAEIDETMALITGNLEKIAEHGRRADGIVKSMLLHSRGGAGDWRQSDITALVEEALNLAYHGARAQDNEFNVTLERDFEKTGRPIDVVPQDVTRVFLNLFGNGFYAANRRRLASKEPGFRPLIKVTTRDLGDGVEVRVRDNGTGIPPEVREKLFQPFFTTKPTGEGTGLGLSISYDIVTHQHGGTIEVESEPGVFTEFTVRLPRSRRVLSSGRA